MFLLGSRAVPPFFPKYIPFHLAESTSKIAQAAAPKSRPQAQQEPMSELAARDSFYAIVGEAIRTGKVHAEKANEIVRDINKLGYDWAVQELQAQMAA